MKKLWYLPMFLLILSIVSCKGQPVQSESNSNGTSELIVDVQGKTNPEINSSPVHLTKADFLQLVMDYEKNTEKWIYLGEKPCLIDFYADWCAPCRITSPILEDLARDYSGKINIYKIDVDVEKELAAVFGISSIPTFLFCPMEGNPTISSGIANTPEATRELFIKQIDELLIKSKNNTTI